MSAWQNIYAQSSLNLFGETGNSKNSYFRLNSLESNSSNFSNGKDWEISVLFGGTVSGESSGNIYILSLAKRLGYHYFYSRYTPGYEKEFIFSTGTKILITDTEEFETTLKTKLNYKEKFGFGYSYDFTKSISAGFSIRYFSQQFTEETAVPVFTDTLNSIITQSEINTRNYWRGDIGINYKPAENLALNISSVNLFSLKENSGLESIYEMNTQKGTSFGFNYSPSDFINFHSVYETTGAFIVGANLNFDMFGGNLSAGASIFHDKNFDETIAGIIPAVNYSTELFSVTLSGVKYFSSGGEKLLSTFLEKKINNIVNNQYSYDRIFLGVNFALSFKQEKVIKLLDVEIKKEIFPTLGDEYLNMPFAVGKIINISEKTVTVKPASLIAFINNEKIFSPSVTIQPGDTASVPFYTNINNDEFQIEKREISQANFYVMVLNDDPEDAMQKPILINNANSWDGKVKSLSHFVKKDFSFSNVFSKNILNEQKENLENVDVALSGFEKIIILFNSFVKEMIYVSDPRSSVEYVQFPNETIKVKGGDCDDLSVAFASLLESIGIETAFVDYKSESGISHINLLINTGLLPSQSNLITVNDKKYFIREDENGNDKIWIPVEMTSLTEFETAWSLGSEKFYKEAVEDFGLAKNAVEIIDIN